MRKIIEKIDIAKDVSITLEYEEETNTYFLIIKSGSETKVYKGDAEEIQKIGHEFFVSSLKTLKDQLELSLLEDMYKKS